MSKAGTTTEGDPGALGAPDDDAPDDDAPVGPTSGAPVGSTLGRYAPADDGGALVEVVLMRLPVLLVTAGRDHHDDLMRELRLLALGGEPAVRAAPERVRRLVEVMGGRHGPAQARRDAEIDDAVRRGEHSIDQVTRTPASAAAAVTALGALLDEADDLAEQGLLLTTPRPPLLRWFSSWYLGQFVEQVQGLPPTPWQGPLEV